MDLEWKFPCLVRTPLICPWHVPFSLCSSVALLSILLFQLSYVPLPPPPYSPLNSLFSLSPQVLTRGAASLRPPWASDSLPSTSFPPRPPTTRRWPPVPSRWCTTPPRPASSSTTDTRRRSPSTARAHVSGNKVIGCYNNCDVDLFL